MIQQLRSEISTILHRRFGNLDGFMDLDSQTNTNELQKHQNDIGHSRTSVFLRGTMLPGRVLLEISYFYFIAVSASWWRSGSDLRTVTGPFIAKIFSDSRARQGNPPAAGTTHPPDSR